jgi:hypothetical protein
MPMLGQEGSESIRFGRISVVVPGRGCALRHSVHVHLNANCRTKKLWKEYGMQKRADFERVKVLNNQQKGWSNIGPHNAQDCGSDWWP